MVVCELKVDNNIYRGYLISQQDDSYTITVVPSGETVTIPVAGREHEISINYDKDLKFIRRDITILEEIQDKIHDSVLSEADKQVVLSCKNNIVEYFKVLYTLRQLGIPEADTKAVTLDQLKEATRIRIQCLFEEDIELVDRDEDLAAEDKEVIKEEFRRGIEEFCNKLPRVRRKDQLYNTIPGSYATIIGEYYEYILSGNVEDIFDPK